MHRSKKISGKRGVKSFSKRKVLNSKSGNIAQFFLCRDLLLLRLDGPGLTGFFLCLSPLPYDTYGIIARANLCFWCFFLFFFYKKKQEKTPFANGHLFLYKKGEEHPVRFKKYTKNKLILGFAKVLSTRTLCLRRECE